MEIADIVPGTSYACRFKVRTWVKDGVPVDSTRLQPGEAVDGEPGWYEGLGVIAKRDVNRKLVEVVDTEYTDRTWVVNWDNCWDVDTVEWEEND